ncbi:hypothetical protein PHLCEN_2v8749 [Hermanssonia centrifuga]|uniref:Uncharacterized protein n=1 Tax=Hermanssonia centrifuga TaxID=98765 RepID=A0A2R6NSR1_9APHY|nr:hypothetical protein PHLCEN_2v8749 [Hermanssonia centrifuga]
MDVSVSADTSITKAKGQKATAVPNQRAPAKPERPCATRKKRPATSDVPLPNIKNSKAIWQGQVVPLYIHFVATLNNPWDADSTGEEIDALQQSWSTAFPNHKHLVTAGTMIYKVAAQRLYEWRSAVGKRGIAAVEWLWKERGLDTVQKHWSLVDFGIPIGGLGMCAAAVERGLLLYQTGKIQTEDEQKAETQAALDKGDITLAEELEAFYLKLKTFSEGGWSKPTQDYIKVIGKLSEGQ